MQDYAYLCSTQTKYDMNKNLVKQLLHAMVWVLETTQCSVFWHGTPVACILIKPQTKYNYEVFRTSLCLVQDR